VFVSSIVDGGGGGGGSTLIMIIFMSEAGQTNNELLTEGLLCALSLSTARKSSRGCDKERLKGGGRKGRGKEEKVGGRKGRKRRKGEGGGSTRRKRGQGVSKRKNGRKGLGGIVRSLPSDLPFPFISLPFFLLFPSRSPVLSFSPPFLSI
jgi:hypothetical protein